MANVYTAFPSTTKPANNFRGALVNLVGQYVTLSNAAECDPAPNVIPTTQPWVGCYGGKGNFTVILADSSEYHFQIP